MSEPTLQEIAKKAVQNYVRSRMAAKAAQAKVFNPDGGDMVRKKVISGSGVCNDDGTISVTVVNSN